MRIPLTKDRFTIVDIIDYDYLNQFKWHFDRYAVRNPTTYMHRVIAQRMGFDIYNKAIDHVNRNKLDNRRDNIRVATPSQNLMNQNKWKNKTSRYKGVSWNARRKKWQVFIRHKYLGNYKTEKQAAAAYDKAAKELFGDYACVNNVNCNFIDSRGQLLSTNTSGFRGVHWSNRRSKWIVKIIIKNKEYYLGQYDNKLNAAKVYNEAASWADKK